MSQYTTVTVESPQQYQYKDNRKDKETIAHAVPKTLSLGMILQRFSAKKTGL